MLGFKVSMTLIFSIELRIIFYLKQTPVEMQYRKREESQHGSIYTAERMCELKGWLLRSSSSSEVCIDRQRRTSDIIFPLISIDDEPR